MFNVDNGGVVPLVPQQDVLRTLKDGGQTTTASVVTPDKSCFLTASVVLSSSYPFPSLLFLFFPLLSLFFITFFYVSNFFFSSFSLSIDVDNKKIKRKKKEII